MCPVVSACRFAVRLASLLVPRKLRDDWAGQWTAEIRHGYALLTDRGESPAEIRSKLLRFAMGAFSDAADLRLSGFDLRPVVGHPAFCLAVPLIVMALLLASTHAFQNCRQAIAGLPGRQPEQLVLLSRSATVMGLEAVPSSADLLAFQKQWTGASLAGFLIDGPVLRVTPGFYDVLGAVPRLPFRFLGHTIEAVKLLDLQPARMGILARLRASDRPRQTEAALTRMTNGRAVSLRFVKGRMRAPLVFAAVVCALALGIGLIVSRVRSRGILFYLVKTALAEGAIVSAWAELAAGLPISSSGAGSVTTAFLLPGLLLAAAALMLWWALLDQQGRCPVCYRFLALPVRIGSHSSIILDRPGVEVLCLRGHGSLLIPAAGGDAAEPPAWTAFHESWKDCFAQGGTK
ncbi:MAG: hypothetical protein P4L56_04175 [Candidatus Sulfopaludibacter sp.]|nr:hypothetical protein [Candidatus Sulfopaludibacter sp.]